MRFPSVLLPAVLLAAGLGQSEDTHSDKHLDTHTDTHSHTHSDVPDDDYGGVDWEPSPFLPDLPFGAGGRGHAGGRGRECNDMVRGCGGVEVTLVPRGEDGDRCPDLFRCSAMASDWLRENQGGKQQLEDLKETTSAMQEELKRTTDKVHTLGREPSSSHAGGRRRLEEAQREVELLLSVHAILLQQLKEEQLLLSASMRRTRRTPGCTINILQSGGLPRLRDVLLPELLHVSECPVDCASLFFGGARESGVYSIVPSLRDSTPSRVFCDMDTDGGGWTVLQRREGGALSFNRDWPTYREGFGPPESEHWIGNEVIHLLTNQGHYSLRIELEDWTHTRRHATYSSFRVDGEAELYRLHVSGFSGSASDSFSWYHDNQVFSTPDTGNICSEISHAGWWFRQCFHANLNGVYYKGGHYAPESQNVLGPDGIVWFSWKNSDYYSLRSVSMMIRPRHFTARLSP